MTKQDRTKVRAVWLLLAIILAATTYESGQPMVVLSSSLIGWFGGIAFVFAWLTKTEENTTDGKLSR